MGFLPTAVGDAIRRLHHTLHRVRAANLATASLLAVESDQPYDGVSGRSNWLCQLDYARAIRLLNRASARVQESDTGAVSNIQKQRNGLQTNVTAQVHRLRVY